MRFATSREIEYLNSFDGDTSRDAGLIDEMSQRLDALRRFDQYFCDADWSPAYGRGPIRTDPDKPVF
jgi:hypothetical protein